MSSDNDDARLARIEAEVLRLSDRFSVFDRFVVESTMRFENGQRAFSDHDKRLASAETQLRPNLARVLTALGGIVVFLVTSTWGVSIMMANKTTASEVIALIETRPNPTIAKKVDEHDKTLSTHTSGLDRLEVKLGSVFDVVNEIKTEIKERRAR